MVLAGSAETDLPFGLTTPPAQLPDEMGVVAVSPRLLPIILPPQMSRFDLKPYPSNLPPTEYSWAALGPLFTIGIFNNSHTHTHTHTEGVKVLRKNVHIHMD